MRCAAILLLACAACAGDGVTRIELAPLPAQIACADDADGDPANGLQFRVALVASGPDAAAYERYEIENSTTDHVTDGPFVDGAGEGLVLFASSHNRVHAYAFDDDGVLPLLFADDANVNACCGTSCRE